MLINETSTQQQNAFFLNNNSHQQQQQSQKFRNSNGPLRQDEIMSNISKSSFSNKEGEQSYNYKEQQSKVVTSDDVYAQLKNIRNDLDKVRQAKKEIQEIIEQQQNDYSSSGDQYDDEDDSNEDDDENEGIAEEERILTAVEKKYQFLMKGQILKSRDAPNIHQMGKDSYQSGGIMISTNNYLELNNKLIEEAYFVSKKREHVQLHLGDSDLSILDVEFQGGYQQAMEFIRNRGNDNNSDNSSNMHDNELPNIDVTMLTNDQRLHVTIPNYDNHYRLYFENPDGFLQNQELRPNQKKSYTKLNEEKHLDIEKKMFQFFSRLNECEQVDVIGKVIPNFEEFLKDLQSTRLKYNVILDRVKKHSGIQFKQTLQNDKMAEMLGIVKDLQKGDRDQGKDGQNGISKSNTNHTKKGSNTESKKQNPDDSHREIQRIKEQLGDAESKLKDAQLQRLQEKVKGFANTEKQLRNQIQDVEKRDESLVSKLENAVCFGKIMITVRPVIIKSFASLLSMVQRTAIDIPFQKQLQAASQQNEGNQNDSTALQELSLVERIDQAISSLLEFEFNELYNELKGYKLNLVSKFALLTEEHFCLYNDLHMTSEVTKFDLKALDFVDLGIVLQNNQVGKRVFFLKIINHNINEKQREVFLMSLYEDQIYKWENCLDPSDEIKYLDRTFKLIKNRLFKSAHGRSQIMSNLDENNDQDANNLNQDIDLLEDSEIRGSAYKSGKSRNQKQHTNLQQDSHIEQKQDDDYQLIEKQFQQNLQQQSRKLQDVGLSVEPPTPNDKYSTQFQEISKVEDLQKAMDEINSGVHQKIKKRVQQQQKEEKEKIIEQQKRNLQKQAITQQYVRAFKELSLGTTFLKYGAMGQPKNRHVFLYENGKKICWKDPGAVKAKSFILIKDIQKITEGRSTKKFRRFSTTPLQEQLSFSIHTQKRTLDLEAANMKEKKQFMDNLEIVRQMLNDPTFAKKGILKEGEQL